MFRFTNIITQNDFLDQDTRGWYQRISQRSISAGESSDESLPVRRILSIVTSRRLLFGMGKPRTDDSFSLVPFYYVLKIVQPFLHILLLISGLCCTNLLWGVFLDVRLPINNFQHLLVLLSNGYVRKTSKGRWTEAYQIPEALKLQTPFKTMALQPPPNHDHRWRLNRNWLKVLPSGWPLWSPQGAW